MRNTITGLTLAVTATVLAGLAAPAAQAADCGPYATLPAMSGPPIKAGRLAANAQDRREVRAAHVTMCLINNEREAAGVPALTHNPWLSVGAKRYTDDMVRNHHWDPLTHFGSDRSTIDARNTSYGNYCRKVKKAYTLKLSENIHYGPDSSPAAAVRSWMESPRHHGTLLDPNLKEFGVNMRAVTPFGRSGGTYTADFGACS